MALWVIPVRAAGWENCYNGSIAVNRRVWLQMRERTSPLNEPDRDVIGEPYPPPTSGSHLSLCYRKVSSIYKELDHAPARIDLAIQPQGNADTCG